MPLRRPLAQAAALACVCLPAAATLQAGDPAPLNLTLLDGARLTGEELAGHPVVVAFWAASHPASVEAVEALSASTDATEAGVVFVGVALDADPELAREAALRVADAPAWEHALNVRQDEPVDVAFYDEAYGIPAAWVLDAGGRVVWTGHPDDLAGPLAEAVAAEPAPAPAWSPEVRDTRVAWAGLSAAADRGGDAEGLLDAAAKLVTLGALDAPEPDARAVASAERVTARLGALPGVDRARLELARRGDPGRAEALDRVLALAGEEATAAAGAQAARVEALERAERTRERGDDAGAVAAYAAIVEAGPEDAPEVAAAAERLAAYEAEGFDPAAAQAQADAAEADRLLRLARGYARGYQEDKAIELLDDILTRLADTPSAEEAASLKEKLE